MPQEWETNSLGRVQTPVLAAISSRYRERENFIAVDSWPVFISVSKDGELIKMRCTEEFTDRGTAAQLYEDCKLSGQVRILSINRKMKEIQPPALYDLTELQKDANRYYSLTAGRTQEIAQRLYEKKLISYPRTSSRFLSEDVFNTLPSIMEKILTWKQLRPYVKTMGINLFDLPRNVIDEDRVTEHHAILITNMYPEGLDREEMPGVYAHHRADVGGFHAGLQGGIHHGGCRMRGTQIPHAGLPYSGKRVVQHF